MDETASWRGGPPAQQWEQLLQDVECGAGGDSRLKFLLHRGNEFFSGGMCFYRGVEISCIKVSVI
jgi:hypothetical protein